MLTAITDLRRHFIDVPFSVTFKHTVSVTGILIAKMHATNQKLQSTHWQFLQVSYCKALNRVWSPVVPLSIWTVTGWPGERRINATKHVTTKQTLCIQHLRLPTPLWSITAALKPYIFWYRLTNFSIILTFQIRGGHSWESLQTTSASPSKLYTFPIFPVTSLVPET